MGTALAEEGVRNRLPATAISLTGPSLASPAQFPGTAARIETGGLSLLVDAAGAVHTEPAPPPLVNCTDYPAGTHP